MLMHEFQSPDADDYQNVTELNLAWLNATTDLRGPQRARLGDAPFLLFSLRETDIDWWRQVLEHEPQTDWLDRASVASDRLRQIQSATLAFLWQLGRRNPYAARLVSGATVAWCELLTATPLMKLIARVAWRADLATSRLNSENDALFHADCTSARTELRRSSHLAALQTLLTAPVVESERQLPAAACHMPRPQMKVADRRKE